MLWWHDLVDLIRVRAKVIGKRRIYSDQRMRALRLLVVSLICLGLVACATSPNNIEGYYVSPYKYRKYSCQELETRVRTLQAKLSTYYNVVQRNSQIDAAITATSLIFFWPAIIFISGKDGDISNYSILKGDFKALKMASEQRGCNILFKKESRNGH